MSTQHPRSKPQGVRTGMSLRTKFESTSGPLGPKLITILIIKVIICALVEHNPSMLQCVHRSDPPRAACPLNQAVWSLNSYYQLSHPCPGMRDAQVNSKPRRPRVLQKILLTSRQTSTRLHPLSTPERIFWDIGNVFLNWYNLYKAKYS